MTTERTKAPKNIKGFTLVELIVVITILTILGTIAFLSLQGQSASARDSKRKTDLSSLSTKVSIATGNGISLLSLISTSTGKVTAPTIGGTDPLWAYNVGTPNYTALGISATDFLDPKGPDYKLGVTTLAGATYQLGATLEADNAGNITPNALVVGTYSPRGVTSNATAVPTISGNNLLFPVASGDIGKFKTGDTVTLSTPPTGVTAPAKVLSISSDLSTLTITYAAGTPTSNATSQVTLGSGAIAATEMSGLIGGIGALTGSVTSGNTSFLPY